MAKDLNLTMIGVGREMLPMVYVLAAFLERDETVWVDEESIRIAAFLISEGIIPVKAEQNRKHCDIAIRPTKCPLKDIIQEIE